MAVTVDSDAWIEVSSSTNFNMTDGEEYLVEVHGKSDGRKVYAVDVNGSSAPADETDAFILWPSSEYPAQDPRVFEKRSGWSWWMKTNFGEVSIKAAIL